MTKKKNIYHSLPVRALKWTWKYLEGSFFVEIVIPVIVVVLVGVALSYGLVLAIHSSTLTPEQNLEIYTQNYELCMGTDRSEEFCIEFARESIE